MPPPYVIRSPFVQRQHSYFNEKICIEPDTDLRRSAYKALPAPPVTPKRIMHSYRFSTILLLILGVVQLTLTLLMVLAGRSPGYIEAGYVLQLNASRVGQDIIRFEAASPTTTAASSATTTAASTSPFDALNPLSTTSPLNPDSPDSPLNKLADTLEPVLNNLTESINGGLGDTVNQIVEGLADQAGIRGVYYFYLNSICYGKIANSTADEADEILVQNCMRYKDASAALEAQLAKVQSSIVLGQTNVSVPVFGQLTESAGSMLSLLSTLNRVIIVFFVISIVVSSLTVFLALPSFFYPASRLLVYLNLYFACVATFCSSAAASILTAVIVAVGWATASFGEALGVSVARSSAVLLFTWISVLCVALIGLYWTAVWFVEVRQWSFVKRRRTDEEVGKWRGIGREMKRDFKAQ